MVKIHPNAIKAEKEKDRELKARFEHEKLAYEYYSFFKLWVCPECGSKNIHYLYHKNIPSDYHCVDCDLLSNGTRYGRGKNLIVIEDTKKKPWWKIWE